MNYLAHILLSGDDDDLLIGNFSGDFIKGSNWELYPERIGQGVLLHRFIDSFADSSPHSMELKQLMYPTIGKFAGVALDVIYDHILAKKWEEYGVNDLLSFSLSAYDRLSKRSDLLPEQARKLLVVMRSGNWLYNYRREEQLYHFFNGMERRIGRSATLVGAEKVFVENKSVFEKKFDLFFREAEKACLKKISSFDRVN